MPFASLPLRAAGLFLGAATLLAVPSMASGSEDTSTPMAEAKIDNEAYTCEIATNGPYKAGTEGTVKITFVAKADYHVNKDYPHKFKAADPPEGVTYPKPVLTKADGSFDEKKGAFQLPFTATKAGKFKLGGKLHFSVCTDAQCRMEKVDLELEVEAK